MAPSITCLPLGYGTERPLALVEAVRATFGPELIQQIEVTRQGGAIGRGGLTLVRFTTAARLDEIVHIHAALGAMIFNPHRYTLEEGGRQSVDDRQLAFRREADQKGLLNPGKMIAWDNPEWACAKMYAWPGLRQAAE